MLFKTIKNTETRHTKLFLYLVLAAALLCFGGYLIFRLKLIYLYHLDLGGLENNVIYGIQKILADFPLYTNPESSPFDLIQKSPIYYYLMVVLCRCFDISTERPIEIFRLSRMLSLFLNLASISIYGLMAYQCFKIKRLATVLISITVMMTFTQHYYSRLDALYGFFFMCCLFSFFKYWKHFQKKYLIVTAICCVLLVLSKQTGAVLVIGMGLSLFWTKNRWFHVLIFGSTGLIGTLLLVLLLDIHPYFYYQNAVLGVKNGMSFDFLEAVLNSQYQVALIVICLVGIFLFYKIKTQYALYNLLLSFTLFYLVFGLISCLKIAAGLNYLIEYKVFMLLVLGVLGFNNNLKSKYATMARLLLYASVFIIFTSKVHHIYGQYQLNAYKNNITQYEKDQVVATYFKEDLVLKVDEYIYFEENGFITHFLPTHMMLPVKSTTAEIYFNHPKILDYSTLFEYMNNGKIKYVLVKEPHSLENTQCLEHVFETNRFIFLRRLSDYLIYQYDEKLE